MQFLGRGLEEVDELFEAKIWAWQFKRHETHEAGRALASLESEGRLYDSKNTAKVHGRYSMSLD